MATITAETLVQRTRQLANMENRLTVEDPEIHSYLTVARKRLTALLVRHGLIRVETTATITATGAASYALPPDLFATVDVFRVENNHVVELRLLDAGVRLTPTAQPASAFATGYFITDSAIVLYPAPATGTYYHVYVPDPAAITYLSTVSYPMAWEEYMTIDAAIQCLSKEESVNPMLTQRRLEVVRAIEDEASMRNLREPYRLQDRRPDRSNATDNRENGLDPSSMWGRRGVRI